MDSKRSTTAELLAVIGAKRADFSPAVVAEAEAQLAARAEPHTAHLETRVRRAGTIFAIVGGCLFSWALFGVTLGVAGVFGGDPNPMPAEAPPLFRYFDQFFLGTGLVQAGCGLAMLFGGLQLRKLRRVGRRVLVGVLWVGFALVVTLTIVMLTGTGELGGGLPFTIAIIAAMGANSLFWGFLLWLPYRFLKSSSVRELCGE